MNIKYITNVRIPTSRAHGYAIVKMCSEFAKAGARVDLIIPDRRNNEAEGDPFRFYKIEKNFDIKKVLSFDFLGGTLKFGPIFYWVDLISFFVSIFIKRLINAGDIVYTRDFIAPLLFSKKRFICLELHDFPKSKLLFNWAIKKPKLFFVLNKNIKSELVKRGVGEDKIHIFPSGVEVKEFNIPISQIDARKKVGLPLDKKIILYSGQFYPWKGIDVLAQAAPLVPRASFIFIGGTEPELGKFIENYGKIKNITTMPFKERSIIPLYLKAADVLVIPQSTVEKVSTLYSSPIKMFEYMASKRPIVASNLSSIRETLDNKSCVFAEPDDPKSLATAINKILENEDLAHNLSENAFSEVEKYSWDKRANTILEIIENNL
jgi:glycosyltransferase involved in cell wall biosynthesis